MPKLINSAGTAPGGHVTVLSAYLKSSGTRIQPSVGAARTPQQPALARSRALTNAKVRRAMRATFGRVAVVLLLLLSVCGCKSASNMFAWGKKKPASTLSEAPPYKPSNPALPSAGQIPSGIAKSLPGSGLSATEQTGATPTSTASTTTAGSAYSALPAGYQQSPYPTTPFTTGKLGSSAGTTENGPTAGSLGTTTPAIASSSGIPSTGYASAVGTGNALPPPAAYRPGAATASNISQPQSGFYNPAYGGVASTSTPPAYAATVANNPAYNASTPSSATASAMPSAGAANEIRVADVRAGAGAAPSAQVAMAGALPAATATNNSATGDRYGNVNATGSSSLVGDRYAMPAATSAAPASNLSAPVASAPLAATVVAPNGAEVRTAQPVSNDYYRPSSAESGGSNGSADAAISSGAPGANPASTESPLRKDPGYRPGGTSDYAPGANMLRPSSTSGESGGSQSNSRPSQGVTPASYQAIASPAPTTPVMAAAPAAPPSDDRYSGFQGTTPSAEPAYGASSPATAQSGSYPDHSW